MVFKNFRVFGAWKFLSFSLIFRGLTISLGSVLMLQKYHHKSSSSMTDLIFDSRFVKFDFWWQICQNLAIFRGRFFLTSGDQISGTWLVRLVLSILRFSSGYQYLMWLVKRRHFFYLGGPIADARIGTFESRNFRHFSTFCVIILETMHFWVRTSVVHFEARFVRTVLANF